MSQNIMSISPNQERTNQKSSICITPINAHLQIIKLIASTKRTFLFIHNNKKYYVNPLVASYYSRKINLILMSDPFFNEYKVKNSEGDFQLIVDFFMTNTIKIDERNAFFILDIGCDLQIDSIISNALYHIPENIFLTNKNNILENIFLSGANIKKVISILSSNFNEIYTKNYIEKLPISFIDLILRSPSLNVEKNNLFSFLSKIFNWKTNPNHTLAKYLPLEIMPKSDVREYLNDYRLNFNYHRLNFFNSFKINNCGFNSTDSNTIYVELPPVPPSSHEIYPGLLKKIPNDSYSLSSSSVAYPTDMQDSYGPEILLSGDVNQYFCTQNGSNEWLEVSFEQYEVNLSGYLLRSWKRASNKVCPVSWNLEGSNDHDHWNIISHEENIQDLMIDNGYYLAAVSDVSYYKFFRFIQLSTGNEGNSVLALSGFELYGTAKPAW